MTMPSHLNFWQNVVMTSTGGGFFNNPVTDDSVIAFTLDSGK